MFCFECVRFGIAVRNPRADANEAFLYLYTHMDKVTHGSASDVEGSMLEIIFEDQQLINNIYSKEG